MSAIELQVNDPVIIADVLSGHTDRFQELIVRHQKMVYAVAWSQLGNVELAEEAAQQTFVQAFSSLAALKDTTKFRSWLAAIAKNASVSISRTRRRELSNSSRWEIEPVAKCDPNSAERANLSDELRQTVAQLPEAHRQVLTLFYLEEQSVKRVAETLGLTESAVKTRLSRARKRLRKELERRLGDALSELTPAQNLALPVMASLSASSALGTAGKLSLVGKVVVGLSSLVAQLGGLIVAMTPAWLLVSWFSKQAAADFNDGDANEFRRTLALRPPLVLFFILFTGSVASAVLLDMFGIQAVFIATTVFTMWGIWKGLHLLRVNNSSFTYASVACVILWCAFSIAMAVFVTMDTYHNPVWIMAPVGLTMMIHFSILFVFRSDAPTRNDYNLFLRAATNGLTIDVLPKEQRRRHVSNEKAQLNNAELVSFAKFLGQRWFISNYTMSPKGLRMELPTIRLLDQLLTIFSLGSSQSRSTITVDHFCRCEVDLSPSDRTAIDELTDRRAQHSGSVLKHAIEKSLFEFSKGNLDSAEQTLGSIEDAEIFKPGAAESVRRRQRRMYAFAIAGTAFLISLWPLAFWLMDYFEVNNS